MLTPSVNGVGLIEAAVEAGEEDVEVNDCELEEEREEGEEGEGVVGVDKGGVVEEEAVVGVVVVAGTDATGESGVMGSVVLAIKERGEGWRDQGVVRRLTNRRGGSCREYVGLERRLFCAVAGSKAEVCAMVRALVQKVATSKHFAKNLLNDDMFVRSEK